MPTEPWFGHGNLELCLFFMPVSYIALLNPLVLRDLFIFTSLSMAA